METEREVEAEAEETSYRSQFEKEAGLTAHRLRDVDCSRYRGNVCSELCKTWKGTY
jgi:hypothetical protein